ESHRERNTTGDLRLVTFTFSHLADAFIQSDVQKREQSSYSSKLQSQCSLFHTMHKVSTIYNKQWSRGVVFLQMCTCVHLHLHLVIEQTLLSKATYKGENIQATSNRTWCNNKYILLYIRNITKLNKKKE